MLHISSTKKYGYFFRLVLIASIMILMSFSYASAQIRGEWSGPSGPDGNGPLLEILVEPSSATLHYGAGKHCEIITEYPMTDIDTKFEAGVDSANGGWCDDAWSGRIRIQLINDSEISYKVLKKDFEILDDGTLKKKQ